jgi:deoxycytidylate deaminase/adenylate kinase family enzyme
MTGNIVVGITGSFGSGCTTLTEVLREDYGFKRYSLSDIVREKWSERHRDKSVKKAKRFELQDGGNELRRESKDYSILASMTFDKVKEKGDENANLVFDSIRNPAEIAFLRNKLANFFLIAVDCNEWDRWERVRKKDYERHKLTYEDFKKDDERDKNEDGDPSGQQVALCVDEADFLIRNDTSPMRTSKTAYKKVLQEDLIDPIKLFSGELRPPSRQESFMGIAYGASLMSQCIKRQVGAVILDERGAVVSIGYNENPSPLKPCYKQFGDCYRDIYIENEMSVFKRCPNCDKKLEELRFPYKCPYCKEDLYKKYIRDRALSKCTALHAEERAIINAGSKNLKGCTLYVTTFPCFSCAQKILDVGIKTIYYVESYPDLDSVNLLESARYPDGTRAVSLQKFEGVKARAFFRIFGAWRREKEREMIERRM